LLSSSLKTPDSDWPNPKSGPDPDEVVDAAAAMVVPSFGEEVGTMAGEDLLPPKSDAPCEPPEREDPLLAEPKRDEAPADATPEPNNEPTCTVSEADDFDCPTPLLDAPEDAADDVETAPKSEFPPDDAANGDAPKEAPNAVPELLAALNGEELADAVPKIDPELGDPAKGETDVEEPPPKIEPPPTDDALKGEAEADDPPKIEPPLAVPPNGVANFDAEPLEAPESDEEMAEAPKGEAEVGAELPSAPAKGEAGVKAELLEAPKSEDEAEAPNGEADVDVEPPSVLPKGEADEAAPNSVLPLAAALKGEDVAVPVLKGDAHAAPAPNGDAFAATADPNGDAVDAAPPKGEAVAIDGPNNPPPLAEPKRELLPVVTVPKGEAVVCMPPKGDPDVAPPAANTAFSGG